MSHVFISYSKKNKDYARRLADYLLEHGFDVWIDDRIDYGDNWLKVMVNAVRDCAAFVVIMTPESEMSHWVELEVAWAHRWNKPMFPILRDGENWPVFELTQYANVLDGTLPDKRFLRELSNHALCKNVHGQNITPHAQAERPTQSIDLAAPPADAAGEGFDTYAAITDFFRLRDAQRWVEARAVLARIVDNDETPSWFEARHYIQEIEVSIEHEKAEQRHRAWEAKVEREYGVIRIMAQHETTDRIWTALQAFWQTFDGYDPDNLAAKVWPGPPISPEAKRLLDVMLNLSVPPSERAEVGRKLAEVGDPRPGVGLRPDGLPDIDWVEIPAGLFLMGSTDEHVAELKAKYNWDWPKNEKPQCRVELPTYWIARYPVTYAQYEVFIQDFGYGEQRWWTDAGWKWKGKQTEPEYWNNTKWHISNHPVVGVTWYEAHAFTQWLGATLGENITLPTEAQWEKAARSTDGRIYPWGNTYHVGYANLNETHKNVLVGPHYLECTTAVGTYSHGASSYGILDMSGNIWEWCLSQWRDSYSGPENNDSKGDAARGLRGGSWDYDVLYARCAARNWYGPRGRSISRGFRVIRSAPH